MIVTGVKSEADFSIGTLVWRTTAQGHDVSTVFVCLHVYEAESSHIKIRVVQRKRIPRNLLLAVPAYRNNSPSPYGIT